MLGAEGRQGGLRFKGGGASTHQNQQTAAWIESVLLAVTNQTGEALSELLRDLETLIPEQEIRTMPESVMSAIVHNRMRDMGLLKSSEAAFKRLLLELLRFRQMLSRGRGGDIVKQSILLLDIYLDIYVDVPAASCGWLVPGLAVVCSLMNRAALAADAAREEQADILDEGEGGGVVGGEADEQQQNKYTKEALNAIRPKLGKVRGDEGRHGAYLVLLGQSIKRCLQLGNMQMAAGFLKLCDSRQINFSHAPRGPMVNFRYYLGRLYMQQEQFDQSECELVWAFSNCPPSRLSVRRVNGCKGGRTTPSLIEVGYCVDQQ
ncbi:hypothetical protein ACSSS7_006315 [Eimeria intestinalis]